MKRLLFIMAIFAFISCSKDSDDVNIAYSQQQQKVQAMFNGAFADYQLP